MLWGFAACRIIFVTDELACNNVWPAGTNVETNILRGPTLLRPRAGVFTFITREMFLELSRLPRDEEDTVDVQPSEPHTQNSSSPSANSSSPKDAPVLIRIEGGVLNLALL